MPFRNVHTWIGAYAAHLLRRDGRRSPDGPRHLLLAVCDHYEPLWKRPPHAQALARVHAWSEGYAHAVRDFRDADGRPPRHTFFFPGEEYAPEFLEPLAGLARGGFGEVEVHLHHDGDTATSLRIKLDRTLADLGRHGHVSRDADGRPRWAFIHGNWSLANGRRDGRWCGVDEELRVLFEAGCYADFTFPSAPEDTQPPLVNQIYWPVGDLSRRRAYDRGERARVGRVYRDRLLLVQGPLCLAPRRATIPVRIESGALDARNPPTPARVDRWVAQGIHVEGRPEWVFVKVHTHGAKEPNAEVLLGAEARATHRHLATRYNDGRNWSLHYVTAREMFNVAMAAMEGRSGNPGDYRDHAIPPPPVAGG
jgi:hypothetical protein